MKEHTYALSIPILYSVQNTYSWSLGIPLGALYQDMEGKNEDDDNKTNFIKESTHANQFADLVAQAGLEQQRSCSRSQSMPVKEAGHA